MLPVIEHENQIGVHDGRETVRDHEHGSSGEQAIDGLLNEALGFGVERGRRFVENEHRRIDEKRPRDRETLTLTARQPRASFAEHRVVAVRQRGDEFVCVRGARRAFDLLLRVLARRRRTRCCCAPCR